jgi:hypothetical protein
MDTLWYAFGMGTHYGMGTYCMGTLGCVLGLMGTATALRLHVLLSPSFEVLRKHDKRRSCHYKRGFP